MDNPLTAILIDDEVTARTTLGRMLAAYCPQVQIDGEAGDIVAGAKLIKAQAPDIVFLDVRIGDYLGFDLLELLPELDFELIFVTAYNKYAIDAFDWNAISYLLKPIVPEQLQAAIARCQERHAQNQLLARYTNFKNWSPDSAKSMLTIANEEGYHFLQLKELLYLQSDQGVTTFYLSEGRKVSAARNIGEFERLLPPERFYRSHQSYIINLEWVDKYLFQDGGSILLRNGQQIPLAKSRREGFIRSIKQ